ncbi:hypothetical protein ACFXK0_00885 [Nocardia sp. NPDC059177]|uniref:hypothetical protein n=1 Tax=Nocardia sp. NPDC059177 TaxID=3346759 RepID=UPI0036CC2564
MVSRKHRKSAQRNRSDTVNEDGGVGLEVASHAIAEGVATLARVTGRVLSALLHAIT